jgi:carbon monoxide dehydrogenase subunit G
MAFKIEERFEIEAPLEAVWAYLIDPKKVVGCLPGAELTETIDAQTYAGRVRVKVGPVAASYKGTARLEEVDASAHRMRLAAEGKESTGAGTAKMSMVGRLAETSVGRTNVAIEADIDIAGKMAQFGRGLMEDVTRQLFRQFAASMQEVLRQPIPAPAGGAAPELTPRATVASESVRSNPASRPVGILSLVAKAIWTRLRRLVGA